jgi:hypothetical protein
MRKCVVCSHWEKQTLQGYPILKIVINLVWENVCSHWEKQTLQGFPILKIVINLAWENVLSVHIEKNKHFKVSPF